ncbi:magnesium chelatase subunit D [Bradyrhizobium sp.]|uniref:magnesium chelatase subunit D n=1 Tax=Bradyrhizobium sp. TaxID=376 RepID=UPI000AAD461B|nr:magnesium chelatase subunit D [Bradyrhizobium sp.]
MTAALACSDAVTAALLFAVDPVGTGGVLLRSRAGPVRDRCLAAIRAALPLSQPMKRLPLHTGDSRLLGGLDLNATLLAGRPVVERGLLAEVDGGVLVLAMAERMSSATTVHITSAMDAKETIVERDGLSLRMAVRFGVVALDEGLDDEAVQASLRDRLAFHVDLNGVSVGEAEQGVLEGEEIVTARERLTALATGDELIEAICTAASALGIASLRAPLLTLRVARASAALARHAEVEQDDIALAARLVLAPRAMVFPQLREPEQPSGPPPDDGSVDDEKVEDRDKADIERALDEVILAAVQAALPPDVLAALRASAGRSQARSQGKAGVLQKSGARGRPAGVLRGDPRANAKLSVIETLRAAAPWQPLRRREAAMSGGGSSRPRILICKEDFRISRFKQRSETTTIFVVDASGSAALHRLAEAKGAVELLLADCYVRRDQVALIAFRGSIAELLLPPTRSLARAKRSLAGLPGGGGTPLAAGLDAAFALADLTRRKGQTPTVVLLTDGRANIARDGAQGRPRAEEDAMSAARQLRAAGVTSVLVDTSPRPGPLAERFAREMGARYLPLPHADATALSKAVLASVR